MNCFFCNISVNIAPICSKAKEKEAARKEGREKKRRKEEEIMNSGIAKYFLVKMAVRVNNCHLIFG